MLVFDLTGLHDEWKKGEVKASLAFILVDLSQASFVVWLQVKWQMEKELGKSCVNVYLVDLSQASR